MSLKPTEQCVRAVAAAISRAEVHDDRMTSDEARIRAWADTCATHGVDDPALACRAVDWHYGQPGASTMRAGDLIGGYRRLRAEQAEREKAAEARALPAPPDRGLGGLPIRAVGEPVWAAYEQHDAIERHCPTCGAKPDEACVILAVGRTRRIPCVARMRAAAQPDVLACTGDLPIRKRECIV